MTKTRRKRKTKIKVKQSAALVHKNDKTRVSRPDTIGMKRMDTQLPRSNGAVFKVRLKKR